MTELFKDAEFDKLQEELKEVEGKIGESSLIWQNFPTNTKGFTDQLKESNEKLRLIYPENSPYFPALKDAINANEQVEKLYENLVILLTYQLDQTSGRN